MNERATEEKVAVTPKVKRCVPKIPSSIVTANKLNSQEKKRVAG